MTVPETLTNSPGAYALRIRLEKGFSGKVGALGEVKLPAGDYIYCGSASGAGGIRARVARHMRSDKIPHWHVDRLTIAGAVIDVLAAPGGSECALVERFSGKYRLSAPIAGFGSSDCSICKSHLLSLPDNTGEHIFNRVNLSLSYTE